MAPTAPKKPGSPNGGISKLPRLPKNARVQKRPLLRPPIPSPYINASQPKVIYISPHTPFISAIKRVRKLLTQIEKRSTPTINLINGKGSDKQKLKKLRENMEVGKCKEPEEVVLKATGRAIERVLGMGLFLQGQGDLRVRIRTGGVGVVDDIVEGDDAEDTGKVEEEGVRKEEEELPESRVRKTSLIEVAVTLK